MTSRIDKRPQRSIFRSRFPRRGENFCVFCGMSRERAAHAPRGSGGSCLCRSGRERRSVRERSDSGGSGTHSAAPRRVFCRPPEGLRRIPTPSSPVSSSTPPPLPPGVLAPFLPRIWSLFPGAFPSPSACSGLFKNGKLARARRLWVFLWESFGCYFRGLRPSGSSPTAGVCGRAPGLRGSGLGGSAPGLRGSVTPRRDTSPPPKTSV